MKFTLEIELGNDAMKGNRDIARALKDVALKVRKGFEDGVIMDLNGNRVGKFEMVGE